MSEIEVGRGLHAGRDGRDGDGTNANASISACMSDRLGGTYRHDHASSCRYAEFQGEGEFFMMTGLVFGDEDGGLDLRGDVLVFCFRDYGLEMVHIDHVFLPNLVE